MTNVSKRHLRGFMFPVESVGTQKMHCGLVASLTDK